MSAGLPWGNPPPIPTPNDPAESLRRIDQHTAELVQWMKYLTAAVVILILVNVVLFI